MIFLDFFKITHFRPVPESLIVEQKVQMDRDKMSCVTVQRGMSYSVEYHVKQPGTLIR